MRRMMLVAVVVVVGLGVLPQAASAAPTGPVRIGFCGGDDWEPAFAAAGSYVYVAWTHFVGDPTCDPASASPGSTYISVSSDGGATFGAPHTVFTGAVGGVTYPRQADPQVAVGGGGAVYVSFLGYGISGGHTDVILARSADQGATFGSAQKVNTSHDCKNCDHPKLVISGNDIYLAYSQATNHFISHSHAGGAFVQANVLRENVVAFAEGGVADAAGNVWYAWADCESSNCTGVPAVDYRVSKTKAGTLSTTFTDVATSVQGPKCPFSSCGFAYFGPQDDIAVGGNGDLYLAWQQGQDSTQRGSPPIINLSRSADGGKTWNMIGRLDDGPPPAVREQGVMPCSRPSAAAQATPSTPRGWTTETATRSTTRMAGTCGFAPPPRPAPLGPARPSGSPSSCPPRVSPAPTASSSPTATTWASP